mmetsp:Transcript_64878/g.146334  ORF Transcript_64878/g.146334 Transcript_64878/m.146334 type:complete len:85 (+) Transcript_64878:39-293(+)
MPASGMPEADGVLCNDASGLPLVANGDVDPAVSGLFTSLIQAAATLLPSSETPPTIIIETDRRNIVVKEYDNLTVSVFQTESER